MYKIESIFPVEGFIETRIGGRDENQDACGYSETPLGFLAVVCDGMGGMQGGSVASSIAVKTIIEYFNNSGEKDNPCEVISKSVGAANTKIVEEGLTNRELAGMGTTFTLILFTDECAYAAYAGDSRIYQIRGERKVFRTFDDSVVFRRVTARQITEEQARIAEDSNIITKALGISDSIDFEIKELPYDKGDRFLLCTDGFWATLPEKTLLKFIVRKGNLQTVLERAFQKTEAAGNELRKGHHDNLTAILLDVNQNSKKRSKMEKKLKIVSIALAVLLAASVILNISLMYSDKKDTSEKGESSEIVAQDNLKEEATTPSDNSGVDVDNNDENQEK